VFYAVFFIAYTYSSETLEVILVRFLRV